MFLIGTMGTVTPLAPEMNRSVCCEVQFSQQPSHQCEKLSGVRLQKGWVTGGTWQRRAEDMLGWWNRRRRAWRVEPHLKGSLPLQRKL